MNKCLLGFYLDGIYCVKECLLEKVIYDVVCVNECLIIYLLRYKEFGFFNLCLICYR